jgi:hypothetical protein
MMLLISKNSFSVQTDRFIRMAEMKKVLSQEKRDI